MSGWDNPHTAEKYEAYAQKHTMYKETSRDLVRLAGITDNMQVIDLCCGTGITSEAVMSKLGDTGHCFSVDLAPAMLDVAREKLTADNISFHQSPAENLHEAIENPVDRIICNSAFWQVDADKTLASVKQALKSDGRFVFNLPGGFYQIPDDESENRQSTPNIRETMRRIAVEDYGYSFPEFKSIITWRLNYESVQEKVNAAGLKLEHDEIITYQQTQAASLEFCSIPIMTERNLPGVDYETRMKILKQATSELDPDDTITQKWAYFVVSS